MAPDQVPPNNFPNTLANCAIRRYARGMTTSPETSPRDELAQIIADRVHEGLLSYDACTPHAEIEEAADEILATGYRKPRTITAVEELDRELIVKSSSWLDAFYLPSQGAPFRNVVTGARVTLEELDRFGNFLPATVLWEPEA